MKPLESGITTSEYAKTSQAERVALRLILGAVGLCVLGTAAAVASMALGFPLVGAAFCGSLGLFVLAFGLGGCHVLAHSTAGYARSRGEVKAAAAMPPTIVNNHATKQHPRV